MARSSTVRCFEKALFAVANDVRPSKPTPFRILVEGRPKVLDAYVEEEICLIAREALRNALQHAEATRVEAEIEYLPSKFRVIVRDDGRGINPQAMVGNPHNGLVAMRDRAGRIGGELRVWSKRGAGTEVELCVPDNRAGACRASSR
jgi:signal transduction histidine kinase